MPRASILFRSRARARASALAALVLGFAWAGLVSSFACAQAPDAGARAPDEKVPSSGPYRPRPSAARATPRELRLGEADGRSTRVVRIPIEGTVDLGLVALVRRVLEKQDAREGKDADAAASVLLLDINTLGGRVDAAIQLRDALLSSKRKTVAFVHPRAISAGALIALSCDVIVFSSGGSMGAATPIELGENGAQPVAEKMVSYFRTEMRSTAEAKGRRGDIAEAMVDASVEIPGLDPAGKLLTLDTDSALEFGMADARAEDIAGVLAALGLSRAQVTTVDENWAERVVRFLTDPVVSSLLMSLGTLGILVELYTPGLGLPGVLGALCLALFFGGHLLVNLAGFEELLLLAVGLALLALEVFVIPGFGAAGVLGVLCIFAALVLTTIGLPLDVLLKTGAWVEPLTRVAIALGVTVVAMLIIARFLPRTRAFSRLVLSSKLASNVHAGGPASFVAADETRFVGQLGVAESDLRPVGVARFGETRVDVVSEGGYVAAGTRVRVREVEGGRIVVRAEPAAGEGA